MSGQEGHEGLVGIDMLGMRIFRDVWVVTMSTGLVKGQAVTRCVCVEGAKGLSKD